MDSACIIMELEEAIEIRQLLATYLNDNSSIDNDKVKPKVPFLDI